MATLNIKTQGKRGGNPQYKEDIGYATLFLNSQDYISIDVFEGYGETYKRREQEEINITIFGEELFTGTRQELHELLVAAKQLQITN